MGGEGSGGNEIFLSLGIWGCSEISLLAHADSNTKLVIMILRVCVCVFRAVSHTVRAPWYQRTLDRPTYTHIHTAARTCLMANHVWDLIHHIRSLIELDQHVLALRGFLHMHFVWDCNRHCYYHYCYSEERIISADYKQLFKRCFKKNIMYHPQREHILQPQGEKW